MNARGLPGGRAALALGLLAVLPFLNGLTADFTYDDKAIVRDNPRLASPGRVGEVFTSHYSGGPLSTAKNFRPVVLLTYAVQRWTTGTDPFPFHVVNVLLHAATTLALAAWLLGLGMPRGPSLAAAALFAVVPIHVEAVTGIVGRAELLSALLVLLAAILFQRAADGTPLRALPYAGALAAFLLALFTKENAVVLPGVVVLGELLRRDVPGAAVARLRRKALPAAGLLLPLAAFVAVRLFVLGGGLVGKPSSFFELDNPLAPLAGPLRAANGLWLLLRYAAKTFVPLGLSADHSAHALDLVTSLADPRAGAALAAVAGLAVAGLVAIRRNPLVPLGVAFFLGTLLPASNILFPIGTIYADRLAYLPSAGLFVAAAGAFSALPRLSSSFRAALLAIAVATYSGATVARNDVFRDDDSLFGEMVAKVPRSARARYNVASLAWQRGELAPARRNLERAVALFSRHFDAWTLLSLVAAKEGRMEDARAACRESLRIRPENERAWRALSRIEEDSGRFEEAERAYADGLRRFPRSRALLSGRAAFLHGRGRLEEARRAWTDALAVDGRAVESRIGLARTLSALGRDGEAVVEARWAIAFSPGSVAARVFLAGRYESGGRPLAAAAELGRAVRAAPRDPEPARLLLELGVREPSARSVASTNLTGIERSFGRPVRNLGLRASVEAFRAAVGR